MNNEINPAKLKELLKRLVSQAGYSSTNRKLLAEAFGDGFDE